MDMKKYIEVIIFFFALLPALAANVQTREYTVADTHSHNDYIKTFLFTGLTKGFGSIEADCPIFAS